MNSDILPAIAALLLGLAGLVWGADKFVHGSAGTARNLGVSRLVIGLTFVSVGTSAPEIIVAIDASLRGVGELAVGNALGSNLANIGLVLGVTALIAPLPTQRHLLVHEGPLLLAVTAGAGLCLADTTLGRSESLVMLMALPCLLWLTLRLKKTHPPEAALAGSGAIPQLTLAGGLFWFAVGLAAMLAGAEALVWSAGVIAREAGVSQLVIGLTLVAVGTSLPELAASLMSAAKGHHDIAVGNIFGSNLFNLLAVMPVAGAIAPLELAPAVLTRDFAMLALLTVLLFGAVLLARRPHRPGHTISRGAGAVLLAGYIAYYGLLAITGQGAGNGG
jgi:cation:H+ antiporter